MWGFNSDLNEGMKPEKTSPKSHRKKTILHSGALTIHVNPKYHLQEMQTYHWWLKTKAQLKIAAFQMRQVRWLDYSQLSELSCNHRSLLRNIWYLSSIKNKMWDILEKKEMDGNKSCIRKDPTAASSCPSPNSWQKRDKSHFYKNFVTAKHCKGGMNTAQSQLSQGNWPFLFWHRKFWKHQVLPSLPGWCCPSKNSTFGQDYCSGVLGTSPFTVPPHPSPSATPAWTGLEAFPFPPPKLPGSREAPEQRMWGVPSVLINCCGVVKVSGRGERWELALSS